MENTMSISSRDYELFVQDKLMLALVKRIYESKLSSYDKHELIKMILGVAEYSEPELKVM